ncbi:MAG TPA: YhjD/YihY/BrkB family envelope integrity protein, partial [Pseudonocardiaceae bacterium]|nr:YhjD/YihY/BrkB family envelope integrity protein [Pseudonocardiaceae bacterium]
LGLDTIGRVVTHVVRWVVLIGIFLSGLTVLYRVADDRQDAPFRWMTPGAVVAAFLWILGSVAFSVYVGLFGSFNQTYGALTGVIVLMLWLYLTSYIVLLGAEINAEAERRGSPGSEQRARE